MLKESAVVVRTRDDRAMVRTYRGEACEACAAAGACKTLGGGKEMEVEVLNYIRASVGDRVELSLPEASFVTASVITWLIPLFSFLGGGLIGLLSADAVGWSADAASLIFAGIGLGLAMPVVAYLGRRLGLKESYIPRITRVLPAAPDGSGGPRMPDTC